MLSNNLWWIDISTLFSCCRLRRIGRNLHRDVRLEDERHRWVFPSVWSVFLMSDTNWSARNTKAWNYTNSAFAETGKRNHTYYTYVYIYGEWGLWRYNCRPRYITRYMTMFVSFMSWLLYVRFLEEGTAKKQVGPSSTMFGNNLRKEVSSILPDQLSTE